MKFSQRTQYEFAILEWLTARHCLLIQAVPYKRRLPVL
jgi:hypothetical protein